MSLDGYVAGPNQSVEHPLGIGGLRLHEWAFRTFAFRSLHGLEGGELGPSSDVLDRSIAGVGATIMGRNMFGGHPGPWRPEEPWQGWWGTNPPFHHPVFVITHHPRETLVLEGGTTFHFVTEGIGAALERAKEAAGGLDVMVAGGAHLARQYLGSGLVDDMLIHLAPILLGRGERLFEELGDDLHGLRLAETVADRDVVHFYFKRP